MDFNQVILAGRLTRSPELRFTQSGTAVCDLGLAVNNNYTKKDGEKVEDTMFCDVNVWGKTAENCNEYLDKGSPVFVVGRLILDTWEGKDGEKKQRLRVRAERVQFLNGAKPKEEVPDDIGNRKPDDFDDDLPF